MSPNQRAEKDHINPGEKYQSLVSRSSKHEAAPRGKTR